MGQKIYCDCFYCKYEEKGRCLSAQLHLGMHEPCGEYELSEEKLSRHLEQQKGKSGRQDYGKSTLQPKVYPLRQESEKISKE